MCPPIILAKLLAQFDPERKFPSPPNSLLLGNQPKPTPQVQWAHRPRTKARGVILQSQHPEAWVTLLLALVLLLRGGVWGLFLHCPPPHQAAHTVEPPELQHSLAELCWHLQWCHVSIVTRVPVALPLISPPEGRGLCSLQSPKTPTEYKKTPCLRK